MNLDTVFDDNSVLDLYEKVNEHIDTGVNVFITNKIITSDLEAINLVIIRQSIYNNCWASRSFIRT